jgi:hypothetical protein
MNSVSATTRERAQALKYRLEHFYSTLVQETIERETRQESSDLTLSEKRTCWINYRKMRYQKKRGIAYY